jgi:malate dehydrogenase
VTCRNGSYEIVQGLSVDAFCRAKLDTTDAELREERAGVESLL